MLWSAPGATILRKIFFIILLAALPLENLQLCWLWKAGEGALYTKPNIALLNSDLVLKAEKDNAEVGLENVEVYQKVVDAEWNILYDKLSRTSAFGAKIVLSNCL